MGTSVEWGRIREVFHASSEQPPEWWERVVREPGRGGAWLYRELKEEDQP